MPSLRERALALEAAEVLVARRDRLRELRLGFRDAAARRLELRLEVGVLDLAR